MIIISACLCGCNCKYNGGNNYNEDIKKIYDEGEAILVCPEEMGGLSTPREPVEIQGGSGVDVLEGRAKVLSARGTDVTEEFIKGASKVLEIAVKNNVKKAILKSKSPSCGARKIYDGTFSGKTVEGNGVTAELLKLNGIEVLSEEEF
ncbi:DUF523 domain-containing protein [Clostridium folliculivorans]|uniref:DUF523 domain-containing protein n=1 Tax=Clostridium folliculivorans TaxID=2886038 RepID=A0A9W5XZS5_9CLOT|nr:DUF523 domain-containing protein [Clostridium folliculivorans]GKU23935.1 hypothetical protein CFOLD11_07610 [Clostridium folliculivorans]GKU30050.1 hypothetical protein CFB3_21570 [Clostridium folliculivorans]